MANQPWKARQTLVVVVLLLIVAGGARLWWKAGEPRRSAILPLQRLDLALRTANATDLIDSVLLPAAIQGRTAAEQTEFLTKALRDEISPEGLNALRKQATFGPLKELFPPRAPA